MLDGTSAPRLREVYLDGVEIVGWEKAFPPTLSELIVKNMDHWGPSLSELFTICISCPNITILEVSNVAVGLDPRQSSAAAPLLEFPSLRKLTLCELGEEVTQNILQRLRFPTNCVVRLFSELLTPHPSTSLTSMLGHHLDNSNDVIDQLTIWIRAEADVIKIKGPRWNITFELADTEAVRDAVLWFNSNGVTSRNDSPQHSRRSIPVSLELDYDILVDGFDFLSSISDLQCIAKIALNSADLTILSHITVRGFKQNWPFPGVRELHFKHPSPGMDPVIKLFQERRGERDELGAAAPLQKIKFGDEFKTSRPARPDSLLMLLDAVDEDTQVSWYGKQVFRD
ncbi:hypothetical protein M407DRAFT_18157 [Tulasnella calospora MUT 4182]|uniref:Uncharacterized protein n=1 Tax=Tulasnella calospora MUT 4182 TaxID=1051891 RepID=A0A0C3QKF7_9AGAM|nr:hypothetical protein M407DRAFT_18157 [Tulasnella calospora MUT 4182]